MLILNDVYAIRQQKVFYFHRLSTLFQSFWNNLKDQRVFNEIRSGFKTTMNTCEKYIVLKCYIYYMINLRGAPLLRPFLIFGFLGLSLVDSFSRINGWGEIILKSIRKAISWRKVKYINYFFTSKNALSKNFQEVTTDEYKIWMKSHGRRKQILKGGKNTSLKRLKASFYYRGNHVIT